MFDLIVSGPDRRQRIRLPLAGEKTLTVGRMSDSDVPCVWEPMLSRRHIELTIADGQVAGRKLAEAANPVFVSGIACRDFTLNDGDAFVVGATEFRLAASHADDSSQLDRLLEEIRFDAGQLQHIPFSDADKRIEVLTHIPSVIWGTRTDEDFFLRVVQLLLAGIPRAEAVAVGDRVEHTAPARPGRTGCARGEQSAGLSDTWWAHRCVDAARRLPSDRRRGLRCA